MSCRQFPALLTTVPACSAFKFYVAELFSKIFPPYKLFIGNFNLWRRHDARLVVNFRHFCSGFIQLEFRAVESFSQIAGLFIRALLGGAFRRFCYPTEVFSANICPGRSYLRKDFRSCLWTLACVTLWFVRRHADTISSRSDRRASNECMTVSVSALLVFRMDIIIIVILYHYHYCVI